MNTRALTPSSAPLLVLLALLLALPVAAAAHGGNSSLIHACINPSGLVRIVGLNDACNSNDLAVDWSKGTDPAESGVRFLALLSGTDILTAPKILIPCCEPKLEDLLGDLPGATASFETTLSGCVVATLSTMKYFNEGNATLFRVTLDGEPMEGQQTQFPFSSPVLAAGDPNGPSFGFSSYTVWRCNVSSGSHTVKVQWGDLSRFGASVILWAWTLIVQGR